MDKKVHDQFFNPSLHTYIQATCVVNDKRSTGVFLNEIRKLDKGEPVYCETHCDKNVRLYRFLGLELVETLEWRGIKQYVLIRKDKRKLQNLDLCRKLQN